VIAQSPAAGDATLSRHDLPTLQRMTASLLGPDGSFWLSLLWGLHIVALSIWIVLQKRPPLSTLAWVLSLAALPVLGLVVYFFLGPQKIRRQRLRRQRLRQLHRSGAQADRDAEQGLPRRKQRLGRLIEAATGTPISSARSVTLLSDGPATFEALLTAIAGAREHIHLEYYIFEPDQTGTCFRDALVERARAGVQVRLLVDAIGSPRLSRRFLAPLRAAGATVALFHPFRLAPLRPLLNLRNHRKIAVIDGRIGFTGGINLCDQQDQRIDPAAFHDLHLRLEGPVVGWLQSVFAEDWHYSHRQPLPETSLYPEQAQGALAAQVFASGPDGIWEAIHQAHLQAIWDARERVWLATAYFVPGEAALFALTAAALRGVDVRILVSRRSDSRVVTYAGRSYYDELQEAGVRIYEYRPGVLHTKALLVDDDCVLLGSANFDQRSFRLNFEVCVALYDSHSAGLMQHQFELDFSQSQRLPRPRQVDPLRRVGEAAARLLSPLL
jgi:cardiolipin synthase A/B